MASHGQRIVAFLQHLQQDGTTPSSLMVVQTITTTMCSLVLVDSKQLDCCAHAALPSWTSVYVGTEFLLHLDVNAVHEFVIESDVIYLHFCCAQGMFAVWPIIRYRNADYRHDSCAAFNAVLLKARELRKS